MLQTTLDTKSEADEQGNRSIGLWFQAPTDEGRDAIPAGLDDIPPGAVLAAIVSSLNVNRLSGHDRIIVLRAHQRLASHYAAQVLADMTAVADSFVEEEGDSPELAPESAAAEVRAALHLTRFSADNEMVLALDLRDRLPRVHELLSSGAIDARRARVIVDGTMHLPADMASKVVDQIVEKAPSLTTGQLRAKLRKLCITIEPGRCRPAIHQGSRQPSDHDDAVSNRNGQFLRHGPPSCSHGVRESKDRPHRKDASSRGRGAHD